MKQTILFLKKEFWENWRRKRLGVLLILFLMVGILSPFTAKILPDIMGELLPKGMELNLPAATSVDSWTQFYKNLSQFCLLGMVILYAGIIANEVEAGTLIPFITKGLSRQAVVLSKSLFVFGLWTFGVALAALVNWCYTRYYFNDSKSPHVLAGLLPLWLYGLMFLAFTLLASSWGKNSIQSMLLVAIFYVVGSLLRIIQRIDHYDPFLLGSNNLAWLTKQSDLADFLPAILLTILLIACCLLLTLISFRKRRL